MIAGPALQFHLDPEEEPSVSSGFSDEGNEPRLLSATKASGNRPRRHPGADSASRSLRVGIIEDRAELGDDRGEGKEEERGGNGAGRNLPWTSAALVFISGAAAGRFSSLADDGRLPTSATAIAAVCCCCAALLVAAVATPPSSRLLAATEGDYRDGIEFEDRVVDLDGDGGDEDSDHADDVAAADSSRLRAQAALGSVGAPPLSPALGAGTAAPRESCARLAESHADLLYGIDRALDAVRTGAALRLGLGPLSTAVARAEIARIGRETRRRRKRALELSGPENADHALRAATAAVGPLGLRGSRRAVRDVMYRQEVSLRSLMDGACSTIEGGCESSALSAEGLSVVPRGVSDVYELTLSSLTSLRRTLGELLSEVLSALFSEDPPRSHVYAQSNDVNTPAVIDSARLAREMDEYLSSAFPPAPYALIGGQPCGGNSGTSEEGKTRSSIALSPLNSCRRSLQCLRSNLEAASVALWAFEADGKATAPLSAPSVRSAQDEGRGRFESSVQEAPSNIEHIRDSNDGTIQGEMKSPQLSDEQGCWWLHLRNMLNEATGIHQSLNRSLFPVAEDDLDEDSISGPVPFPGGVNRRPNTAERLRFEHDGGKVAAVVGPDLAAHIPPETEGKTVVFSGKGELTGARSTGGREYLQAEEKSKMPPPPSQIDHPISRMTLLRELQARIDGMSLAEEYETSDSSKSVDFLETETSKVEKLSLKEEALVRVTGASSPPVAPFFLGASGSLLTELIDSLDRSADVDCIVHESTNTS